MTKNKFLSALAISLVAAIIVKQLEKRGVV